MIPFRYGSVVGGKDFCGRQASLERLREYIRSSQNVLVQGERRIGKTSLIYETTRRLRPCFPVFVDIMEVKSAQDLCRRMVKAVLSAERKSAMLTRALKAFASLRPQLGVDPVTGLPTVSLDPSVDLGPDSLEGVLDWIASSDRKHAVVVLDEFQDVLNLPDAAEVLAVLRGKIQYHDRVAYVFCGSIRNRMDEIFTHPESPLFKAAIPISLGPIPRKAFGKFLRKKFAEGKRTVSDPLMSRIFDETDGVTGDIQQMCEALWSVSSEGAALTEADFHSAYELIFAREVKSYELILAGLTALQLRCLSALARIGGSSVTSGRFLKESGIRQPSSVSRAIARLVKMKILFVQEKEYRFVNPFFRAWLVSRGF
jgi:hypothetical protein